MNFRNFLRRLAVGAGLGVAGITLAQAPTLIAEATPITTYAGYPAKLNLVVTSPNSAPSFQWYLLGFGALPGSFTNVSGATNATLVFTNLAANNNGAYLAIITNNSGAITSAPVNLVVLARPSPALNFGELITHADGSATLPISYVSQGAETNVSFSVAFDGAVLKNPRFEVAAAGALPEPPAGTVFGQASDTVRVTLIQSNSDGQASVFGIKFDLNDGRVFPAGEQRLGQLRWGVTPDRKAYQGRIVFKDVPSPIQARSITNGLVLNPTPGQAPPVVLQRETVPVLDRQSGLYLQKLFIANPGIADLTNARLTVVSLPVDSKTNQVVVYNAPGRVGTNASVELGALLAGSSQPITLEYFVPDHGGWPANNSGPILPELVTSPGFPSTRVVPAGVILADGLVRVTRQSAIPNAGFSGVLLDFPTRTNRLYYVQYSAQSDFTQTNGVRLVLPPLPGTGSTVQWIDNGPPKTESLPVDATTRFYRILEVR